MRRIILLKQSKAFTVLLLIFILSLVCMYVIQINLVVSTAYHISGYEKNVQRLFQETKILQVEHTGLRSFKTIEELASVLQFEKVTHVQYIQSGGAVVAKGDLK